MFKIDKKTKDILAEYKENHDLEKIDEKMQFTIHKIIEKLNEKEIIDNKSYEINNNGVSLQLIVCNTCNMACKYCYANDGTYNREKSRMSFSIAKKAIDYMINKYDRIETLTFFGGEPLLCIELIEQVCEYLSVNYKDKFDKIGIMSNLYKINNRILEVIEKYNIQVATSLDGDEKLNAYRVDVNGKETYSTVMNNINEMYNAVKQPIAVEVTMSNIHSDNNYDENKVIEKMMQFLPVKNYTVNKVEDFDGEMVDCKYEGCTNSIEERINKFIETGIYDMVANDLVALINKKGCGDLLCSAGITKFTILPDGDIYPCHVYSLDNERRFLMGNINSLDDSVFEEKIEQVKRISKKNYYSKCKDCFAKPICTSCLGMKVTLNQELPHDNLYCEKKLDYHNELIEVYAMLLDDPIKYKRFKEQLKEVNGVCESC